MVFIMKKQNDEKLIENTTKTMPVNVRSGVVAPTVSVAPNIKNLMGNDYAKNTLMILRDALADYRISNKNLAKIYAEKYLRTHMHDTRLIRFMINAIKYENVNMGVENYDFVSEYDEEPDGVEYVDKYLQKIRKNQRWFFDLMLYLDGKYTDRQLLNSEFVKIIKKRDFVQKFSKNTEIIDCLSKNIAAEYVNYKQNIANKTKENIQQKIK